MDPDLKEKRKKRKKIHKVKKRDIGNVQDKIDVTPLVNVGLILLIIFMVITPMLSRGKQVPMPQTEYHAAQEDAQQAIVVLDRRENLYVGKKMVENLKEVQEGIQKLWEEGEAPAGAVYLKADPTLDYGKVYPVMMALHDIGVNNVELGTEEKR